MHKLHASLLAVALGCSVATASAQAPSSKPASPAAPQKAVLPRSLADAMTNKARDLYSEGVQAMAQGRVAEARAAFVGAWALEQHYSIACNLGDAELRLGRPREAAEKLVLCVREIEKDAKATEAERAAVKKVLANATAKLMEVVIAAGTGDGQPASVTVTVDGAVAGQAGPELRLFLEPGKHAIALQAEGFEVQQLEVDGTAGAQKRVQAALKKKARAVPTASVTATSTTPAEGGPRKEILIAGGVVAGAGLIAGAVLLGVSVAGLADAKMQRDALVAASGRQACNGPAALEECRQVEGSLRSAQDLGNAGASILIGAGLVSAGTVIYALVNRAKTPPSVQASAFVGPAGAGAVVHGSF